MTSRNRFTSPGCALLLALVPGCGERAELQPIDGDVVDVPTVVSEQPRWAEGEGWRVTSAPRLAIGRTDGPDATLFYRLDDATMLTDGTIAAANSGSSEIRFFDASGEYLGAVGRRGAGPGEFAEYSPLRTCRTDDGRLLIADSGNDRFHVFTRDGLVRTVRLEPVEGSRPPAIVGCVGDRSLLAVTYPDGASLRGDPGELIGPRLRYVVVDDQGQVHQAIADAMSRTRYVNRVGQITHYPFLPFAPEPLIAGGGGRIYLNTDGSAAVVVRDSAGVPIARYRWSVPARAAVADVWDRYVTESLADMREERRFQYEHFYAADLPLPASVPAVQALLVDEAGNVWAQRYRLDWETGNTWDVLAPDGAWLGAVELPVGFTPFEIGDDYVLGGTRDAFDTEQLVVLDLIKGAGS